MIEKSVLYKDKKECCGCGACKSICPCGAISMRRDELGFNYPHIDESKCINCGLCNRVCVFNKREKEKAYSPLVAYAAASNNQQILEKSTSGGIFAELASCILSRGGVVFGCSYGDDWSVSHIEISSAEDICKLQGSKYVESDTNDTFFRVKQCLIENRIVLYSGTPCQISALRSYLKNDYSNLYCVDIICHGVGAPALFESDIRFHCKEQKIQKISFRDKSRGWGTCGIIFTKKKKIKFDSVHSAYYYYYLKNAIFRDSCYNCRYASEKRSGDLTLGDYWNVESAHRNIEDQVELKKGVSCVLVNTPKGACLMNEIADSLTLIPSEYQKIKQRNGQLVSCCTEPKERSEIFDIYNKFGYQELVKYWRKTTFGHRFALRLKALVPRKLKTALKKRIKRKRRDVLSEEKL